MPNKKSYFRTTYVNGGNKHTDWFETREEAENHLKKLIIGDFIDEFTPRGLHKNQKIDIFLKKHQLIMNRLDDVGENIVETKEV